MLIATDLDGTLVPNGADQVSARTAEALARADEAGVPVVFVTGRPLRWMEQLWPHVGRHGRAIVSNGAVVYDVPSRSAVRVAGLEPDAGLAIAGAIRTALPDASFAIECLDGIRVEDAYDSPHDLHGDTPRGRLDRLWNTTAVKLLVRHNGPQRASPEDLHRHIAEVVGITATCTWSMPGLMEISAPGVTKASALRWLTAQLGVDQRDVVAFGDMPNDIPMLRWAGGSYAVQGAHPDVVAAADRRAPGCADDGVATTIDALLAGSTHGRPPTGCAPG
ncbi:MAG: HAD family phosphatase [Nitriliruptoraceae bacterium]|nr:HAD family phosphatase [Nitriliruptoraceae bacterium]